MTYPHLGFERHNDLGPFKTEGSPWGSYAIMIPSLGTKIMCVSANQSIRGLRHGAHRPDLIICDDVEDIRSVQSEAGRKKLFEWFKGEVMLAGDENTRVIVLGNLLHEESLMMKLRDEIAKEKSPGTFRAYPLMDDNEQILWPEKFTKLEDINELKDMVADDETWRREYLLEMGTIITISGIPRRGPRTPEDDARDKEEENKIRTVEWGDKKYVISVPQAGCEINHIYDDEEEGDEEDGYYA